MLSIDWVWWLTKIAVKLDWWPGSELDIYVYVCRLNVILLAIAACNVLLIVALLLLRRSGIEVTFRW